jgi:hypothetical protein
MSKISIRASIHFRQLLIAIFNKKLKTLKNQACCTYRLRQDSYKSKLDFTKRIAKFILKFRHMVKFGPFFIDGRKDRLKLKRIKEEAGGICLM